ncbi:klaroid protein-like isoform X2 [Armigeres subalbatus]|uniref:klaroid protein-like isoform X2 n=1 Tax=Armigeres subalbatus TaxID=124917 RepID=UPI002ED156A9
MPVCKNNPKLSEKQSMDQARSENWKNLCLIVLSAVASIAVYSLYVQNSYQANQINDLQSNFGELLNHFFSSSKLETTTDPKTTQLAKLNFRDQVFTEIQEARKVIDVLQHRVNFLEKINYDKFGRTDYASSDLGGKVISVSSNQRGSSIWNFIERKLFIGRFRKSNVHCCIIQNNCMGYCQAFYGSSAVIVIQLMANLFIDGVTVEHTPNNAVPDALSRSAMKKFSIWGSSSSVETTDLRSRFHTSES